MAPRGFCNRGEVRYGSIGGLEYEVPQSRLYCLRINVALCSTALQCICRVIRRSSMTMKAHTYYIIFGRPPIGGSFPPLPPGGATDRVVRCCWSVGTGFDGEPRLLSCATCGTQFDSSWQLCLHCQNDHSISIFVSSGSSSVPTDHHVRWPPRAAESKLTIGKSG